MVEVLGEGMKEKKSKIKVAKFKSILEKRTLQCIGCRDIDYHISDNFGNIKMSSSLKLSAGGQYISSIMVICKNCGLMSFYAVEVLSEKK